MEINKIHPISCIEGMEQMNDSTIDLIVTSPPYNIGVDYGKYYNDNQEWQEYYNLINSFLKEAYRVLKDNGRMIVNLPENKREPIHHKFVNMALRNGFNYLINIIWYKKGVSGRTAWGSWNSCSAPMVIPPFEYITVFYKGEYKKTGKQTDLTKKEFIEWTYGWWDFGSDKESNNHPATFPRELPRRCIKLFSYVGDVVLDPFAGSGTTLVEAKNLKRKYIGFEINPEFVEMANNRLSQKLLNDCGGTNFTKSSADDFPTESLINVKREIPTEISPKIPYGNPIV